MGGSSLVEGNKILYSIIIFIFRKRKHNVKITFSHEVVSKTSESLNF